MTRHGGDILAEMLIGYGVRAVFGLAGGQTPPLYDAIYSRASEIRHVPMRDERNAVYAADGYARLSGRVGVCDASFASGWGGWYFEIRDNLRAIFLRGMGGLGWALPAAIGAKIARPRSQVVALAGDGAMTYSLGELATLMQEGLHITIVVLNNSATGWIKWEQAVFWNSRFQSTDPSDGDFAAVARALGCAGVRVEDPGDTSEALAQALAANKASVVDGRSAVTEAAVPKFSEAARARPLIRESFGGDSGTTK